MTPKETSWFLAKFSKDAKPLNIIFSDTSALIAGHVEIDKSDRIYITLAKEDITYLLKYTSDLQKLNSIKFGKHNKDIGVIDILVDEENIWLTGEFAMSFIVNDSAISAPSSGYRSAFIAKIDTSLKLIWL